MLSGVYHYTCVFSSNDTLSREVKVSGNYIPGLEVGLDDLMWFWLAKRFDNPKNIKTINQINLHLLKKTWNLKHISSDGGCEGCKYFSPGQLSHMGTNGCLSDDIEFVKNEIHDLMARYTPA